MKITFVSLLLNNLAPTQETTLLELEKKKKKHIPNP
jgi:hypothetical protein